MKSVENKPWGTYEIIQEGLNYLVKKILVKPKGQLSFQSHEHRSEHWIIVQGHAEVQLNDKIFTLKPNDSIFIPQKSKHSLANNRENDLIIIEVWYGEKLSEDDITRYKDIYGRE